MIGGFAAVNTDGVPVIIVPMASAGAGPGAFGCAVAGDAIFGGGACNSGLRNPSGPAEALLVAELRFAGAGVPGRRGTGIAVCC